jgi:enamine deaminase RidA (YjgF/YER057c/UK114 family)
METGVKHINPEGLFKSPAFSQAVTAKGNGTTVYIGGQNAVNAHGEPVGGADLALQTKQVMQNLQTTLAACGASMADVVKLNICLVQGQDAAAAFQQAQPFLGDSEPPAVTAVFVAGLGNPAFLLEIDAVAFVAEKD